MIHHLFSRIWGKRLPRPIKTRQVAPQQRRTQPRAALPEHCTVYDSVVLGIDDAHIDPHAFEVAHTLHEAGYVAYIVGGAVRDLILQKQPKDFDIATDATPEQVKRCFRRALLIGKRFKIVHVIFGKTVIEVSTFRAAQSEATTDDQGRIVDDNVYGTLEEDALRRDFSMNGLYLDPLAQQVFDFHGGIADLQLGVLRMIGDPATRYREDPVRILRAIRFAGKLGVTIHPDTQHPITELAPLLHNVPSGRMFDEAIKLLTTGHIRQTLAFLKETGLNHALQQALGGLWQPILHLSTLDQVTPDFASSCVDLALRRTDERIAQGKSVSAGFLFAALFWPQARDLAVQSQATGEHPFQAIFLAMDQLEAQLLALQIPRRFVADIRELWSLQPRFHKRVAKSAYAMISHARFKSALDFLQLRASLNDAPAELAVWWETFANASDEAQAQLLIEAAEQDAPPAHKKRRKPARHRKLPTNNASSSLSASPQDND